MSDTPEPTARELLDGILNSSPEALQAASAAGANYLKVKMREGDAKSLFTRLMIDPETAPVPKIARAFARGVADYVGLLTREIDARNRTGQVSICASHDFCDANVFMQEAMLDVTGIDAAAELPEMSELTRKLWDCSWRYAKLVGFHRLSAVRGCPDDPPDDLAVEYSTENRSMSITLPTTPPLDEDSGPIIVELDHWGRNPHLQVLCRNHGADEEPAVCVRYDQAGKVVEVVINNEVLVVSNVGYEKGRRPLRMHRGTGDTPWEIEREANPVCNEGDKLKMPSGLVADVMRLRFRYLDDIELFRAYDETYGILARMDSYPESDPRHQVYTSIEQAWEVNPLTAGTTNPADFSTVFETPKPKDTNDKD